MAKARHIIQCKHYRWTVFQRDRTTWYLNGRSNGSRVGKRSLETDDYDQALKNLAEIDQQIAEERGLCPPVKRTTTLALSIEDGHEQFLNFCQRPRINGGVRESTAGAYATCLKTHAAFCRREGIEYWQDITPAHYEAFNRFLAAKRPGKKPYSAFSQFNKQTTLRMVANFLHDRYGLSDEALFTEQVRRPRTKTRYCFSTVEIQAMVEHCSSRPELRWLVPGILWLAGTGLRIGELIAARISDVVEIDGRLFLHVTDEEDLSRTGEQGRTTKSGADRRIPVRGSLVPQLDGRRGHHGPLVVGPDGGPLVYETVLDTFKAEVIAPLASRFVSDKPVRFEHAVLHSFRHHFVSDCFARGIDEGCIREWLGHHDSAIVERYRHLAEVDSWTKMQTLDSGWSEMLPDGLAATVCSSNGTDITSRRNVNDSSTTPKTTT